MTEHTVRTSSRDPFALRPPFQLPERVTEQRWMASFPAFQHFCAQIFSNSVLHAILMRMALSQHLERDRVKHSISQASTREECTE